MIIGAVKDDIFLFKKSGSIHFSDGWCAYNIIWGRLFLKENIHEAIFFKERKVKLEFLFHDLFDLFFVCSNDQAALYYSQQQHRVQQQAQQQIQHQYAQPMSPPILVSQNNQTMLVPNISAHPPSPPVFQEVFRNSRFALGDNAIFEGRISGWPRPTVTWLRKDLPLPCNTKI